MISPPNELMEDLKSLRVYPDFTWQLFLEFTQKHYRADMKTLDTFTKWLQNRREQQELSNTAENCLSH